MSEQLPGFMQEWHFAWVYLFLLLGALARGQAMYWLARVVTEQTLSHTAPRSGAARRMHDWLEGGGASRGIESVRKWGLPVVTMCYFTVGFQTMVMTGAGVLRISWWKYTLATVPGSLGWALIYSTIGFAALGAVLSAAAGSPLGILAVVVLLTVGVGLVVARRRRRSSAAGPAAAHRSDPASPRGPGRDGAEVREV